MEGQDENNSPYSIKQFIGGETRRNRREAENDLDLYDDSGRKTSDLFDTTEKTANEIRTLKRDLKVAFTLYRALFQMMLDKKDSSNEAILWNMVEPADTIQLHRLFLQWDQFVKQINFPSYVTNSQDFRELSVLARKFGQMSVLPDSSDIINQGLAIMEGEIQKLQPARKYDSKSNLKSSQYNDVLQNVLKNTPEENKRLLKIVYEEEDRQEKLDLMQVQLKGETQEKVEVVRQYYNFRKQCLGRVSAFCSNMEKKFVDFIKNFKVGSIEEYQKTLQLQYAKFRYIIQQTGVTGVTGPTTTTWDINANEYFAPKLKGGAMADGTDINTITLLKDYLKEVAKSVVDKYTSGTNNQYPIFMKMIKEMSGVKFDEKEMLVQMIIPAMLYKILNLNLSTFKLDGEYTDAKAKKDTANVDKTAYNAVNKFSDTDLIEVQTKYKAYLDLAKDIPSNGMMGGTITEKAKIIVDTNAALAEILTAIQAANGAQAINGNTFAGKIGALTDQKDKLYFSMMEKLATTGFQLVNYASTIVIRDNKTGGDTHQTRKNAINNLITELDKYNNVIIQTEQKRKYLMERLDNIKVNGTVATDAVNKFVELLEVLEDYNADTTGFRMNSDMLSNNPNSGDDFNTLIVTGGRENPHGNVGEIDARGGLIIKAITADVNFLIIGIGDAATFITDAANYVTTDDKTGTVGTFKAKIDQYNTFIKLLANQTSLQGGSLYGGTLPAGLGKISDIVYKLSCSTLQGIFSTIMIQLEKFTDDDEQRSLMGIISNNYSGGSTNSKGKLMQEDDFKHKTIQGAEMFYQIFINIIVETHRYFNVQNELTQPANPPALKFHIDIKQNSKFSDAYRFIIKRFQSLQTSTNTLARGEYEDLVRLLNPVWKSGNGSGDYRDVGQSGINPRTKNLIQELINEMMEGLSYQASSVDVDDQHTRNNLREVRDIQVFKNVAKQTGFTNNIKMMASDYQKQNSVDYVDSILDTVPDVYKTMNDKYLILMEQLEKMVHKQRDFTTNIAEDKKDFLYYIQKYYRDPNYLNPDSRDIYVYDKYVEFANNAIAGPADLQPKFIEQFGILVSYYLVYCTNIMKLLYEYHHGVVDPVISMTTGNGDCTIGNVSRLQLVMALICNNITDVGIAGPPNAHSLHKQFEIDFLRAGQVDHGTGGQAAAIIGTVTQFDTFDKCFRNDVFKKFTMIQKFNYLMLVFGGVRSYTRGVETGVLNISQEAFNKYVRDYKQSHSHVVDPVDVQLVSLWQQYQYVMNDVRVQECIMLGEYFKNVDNMKKFVKHLTGLDDMSVTLDSMNKYFGKYFKKINDESGVVGDIMLTMQKHNADNNNNYKIVPNSTKQWSCFTEVTYTHKYYLNREYENILRKWYYPPYIYPDHLNKQQSICDQIIREFPLVSYSSERYDCSKLCSFLKAVEEKILKNYQQFGSGNQQINDYYKKQLDLSLNYSDLIESVFKYKIIAPVSIQTMKSNLKDFYRIGYEEEIKYRFDGMVDNSYENEIYSMVNSKMIEQQNGAMAGIEKSQTFISKQLHVDSIVSDNYSDLIESVKIVNKYMKQCIDTFSLNGKLNKLPASIQDKIIRNDVIQEQIPLNSVTWGKYTMSIPERAFQTPFSLPEIATNKIQKLDQTMTKLAGGMTEEEKARQINQNVKNDSTFNQYHRFSDITMLKWLFGTNTNRIIIRNGADDADHKKNLRDFMGWEYTDDNTSVNKALLNKSKNGQPVVYSQLMKLLNHMRQHWRGAPEAANWSTTDGKVFIFGDGATAGNLDDLINEIKAMKTEIVEMQRAEQNDLKQKLCGIKFDFTNRNVPGKVNANVTLNSNIFGIDFNQNQYYQRVLGDTFAVTPQVFGRIQQARDLMEFRRLHHGDNGNQGGRTRNQRKTDANDVLVLIVGDVDNKPGVGPTRVSLEAARAALDGIADNIDPTAQIGAITPILDTIEQIYKNSSYNAAVPTRTNINQLGLTSLVEKYYNGLTDTTFEGSNDVLYKYDQQKNVFAQIPDLQNISYLKLSATPVNVNGRPGGGADILTFASEIKTLAKQIQANGKDFDPKITAVANLILTENADNLFGNQLIFVTRWTDYHSGTNTGGAPGDGAAKVERVAIIKEGRRKPDSGDAVRAAKYFVPFEVVNNNNGDNANAQAVSDARNGLRNWRNPAPDFKRILYCLFIKQILKFQNEQNPIYNGIALMQDIERYMINVQQNQKRNPVFFGLPLDQFVQQCVAQGIVVAPNFTLIKPAATATCVLRLYDNNTTDDNNKYFGAVQCAWLNSSNTQDGAANAIGTNIYTPNLQPWDYIVFDDKINPSYLKSFVANANKHLQTLSKDMNGGNTLTGGMNTLTGGAISKIVFLPGDYDITTSVPRDPFGGGTAVDADARKITDQWLMVEVSYKYSNPILKRLVEKQRESNVEKMLLESMSQLFIYDQRKSEIVPFDIDADNDNLNLQRYEGQLLFIPIVYALSKSQKYDYTLQERKDILANMLKADLLKDIDDTLRNYLLSDKVKQVLQHLRKIYSDFIQENYKLLQSNQEYREMYQHYKKKFALTVDEPDVMLNMKKFLIDSRDARKINNGINMNRNDSFTDNLIYWMVIESEFGIQMTGSKYVPEQQLFKQLWTQMYKMKTQPVLDIAPQKAKLYFTRRLTADSQYIGQDHYYQNGAAELRVPYPQYDPELIYSGMHNAGTVPDLKAAAFTLVDPLAGRVNSNDQTIQKNYLNNIEQINKLERLGVTDLHSTLYQWMYYYGVGLENKKTLTLFKVLDQYKRTFRKHDGTEWSGDGPNAIPGDNDTNITTGNKTAIATDAVKQLFSIKNPFRLVLSGNTINVDDVLSGTNMLSYKDISDDQLYLTNIYYRYGNKNPTPLDISFNIQHNAGITEKEIVDTSSTLGLFVTKPFGDTADNMKEYFIQLTQVFKNKANRTLRGQHETRSIQKIFNIVELNPINPLSLIKRNLSFPITHILGLYMYKYTMGNPTIDGDDVSYKFLDPNALYNIILNGVNVVLNKMKTQRKIGKMYMNSDYLMTVKRKDEFQNRNELEMMQQEMTGGWLW